MERVICQYCGNDAVWCENKEIYGRNWGKSYMCWLCKPCNAYVGCHNNTREPLGTLANKELREWRKKAHAKIDPLWKSGAVSRKSVYIALRNKFGKGGEIHIGHADIELCKRIVAEPLAVKALKVQREFKKKRLGYPQG